MTEPASKSLAQNGLGIVLVSLGLAVFAVRLLHEGAYAMPRGGNLFGGIGALVLGIALLAPKAPRGLRRVAVVLSPIVLFFGLYATMAELEEVVSLYATNSAGEPAELRLWIIDREDGEWVGMPRTKAIEHALDGVEIELLRRGETRCVVPVLHEDREVVRTIHALKLEKYAVARISASIGLYPNEATDASVSLRLDECAGTS